MKLAVTILGIVLGSLGHVMLLGLCLFGMANASDKQMLQIKLWMAASATVWLASAGAGVWLFRGGHPWWGLLLNLLTPIVMLILVTKATTP